MQAYLALLNRASGVASTPYQGFQGEETAPINEQQQAGIGNINQISGPNSQFIGQIDASGNPISAADIQRYQDPYTNDVIHATQADFDVQNQRANSTVTGNAAAQGALGGDRVGVAQALTAEGQARVQAPVIAGLRSQGYQQAVNTAENQQQQAMRAGVSAQSAAMQGAQAQVGAGTLEQQTQQAQDTQARQDYYQQQGYPFQVAQWLAAIDTGVGGSMGGTSTSTGNASTQGPSPNPWTQALGLGLAGASLFPKEDGGAVTGKRAGFSRFAEGGGVHDDFNTMLSPDQERAFQSWKSQNAANDSGADYDLRGAYLANMQRDPENGHMGDRFKKPNHPTFSDQSQYATGDQRDRAGFWVGPEGPDQTFVPPVATKRRGGQVMLRAGFASGGSPYGGIGPSWVPVMDPRASPVSVHASMPSAPQAPKQSGLSQDQMKGIGTLAQKGWNAVNDYADPGTAENLLPGLTADDYGSWRGGRIKRYATGGFADGGVPDFNDRFDAAYPNMSAGVGASRPAVDTLGPTYDDGGGPFRLSSPEDLNDWRARVDRDNGKKITESAVDAGLPPPQLAAAPDVAPLPPEVTSGVSSKPRMTASAAPPEGAEDGTEALSYAGSPRMKAGVGAPQNLTATEQEKPGGILDSLGIKMTPELRQGLMQAGLAMMATTRGGPGSFLGGLGEAGMAGVGAYSKSVEAQQKHDLEQMKLSQEQERMHLPYEQMTAAAQEEAAKSPLIRGPDGKMIVNPAWVQMKQKEADITQKDNWAPLPGDGINPDRMYNKVSGEVKEVPAQQTGTATTTLNPGQFDYRANAPQVNKGDTVPEPAVIAGHSPELLKRDAELYLATGQLPKASVSARSDVGRAQMIYQRAVQNYGVTLAASKGLNMAQMADLQRFGTNAAKFPLSKQGDQTVAIGTAIRHIGALEDYAKAWDASKGNVNAPILRQAAAKFATFLGKAEPTNLEEAASIAGPEIIKAIGVAGGGTGGEREAQEFHFRPGAHTDQILGAANVAKTFLAGQLPAKEAQASNVGFPHERFMQMVGPTEYDYLSAINHGKAPTATTGEKPKPSPADIDYARTHPEVKDKFIARFGVSP